MGIFTPPQVNIIINNPSITINSNNNVSLLTQQILIDLSNNNNNNYSYDYILNLKLSYSITNIIDTDALQFSKTKVQPIPNTPPTILNCKISKNINDKTDSLLIFNSTDFKITLQRIKKIQNKYIDSDPYNIDLNQNKIKFNVNYNGNIAIAGGFIPNRIITAAWNNLKSKESDIYVYIIPLNNFPGSNINFDITKWSWAPEMLPDDFFPEGALSTTQINNTINNIVPYSQVSADGKIIIITYYYYKSLINDSANAATSYIIINYNYIESSPGTPYIIKLSSREYYYRQIKLTYDGTKLYLLSYPLSLPDGTYISSLYVYNFPTKYTSEYKSNNQPIWTLIKEFILPSSGYCPILNVSHDGQYITLYYNFSIYCKIQMSSDYGATWTLYTTNYNIDNTLHIDTTTMSLSGTNQTYLILNNNPTILLSYFSYNKWLIINSTDETKEITHHYDISEDFRFCILYKPNYGGNVIFYPALSYSISSLFNNLYYNTFIPATTIYTVQIDINETSFLNALDSNIELYATTNNKNIFNTVDNFGSKILQIIFNQTSIDETAQILYPNNLSPQQYNILLNTIIKNSLLQQIKYIFSLPNIQSTFMSNYMGTINYQNDIRYITTTQIQNITNVSNGPIFLNFNLTNLSIEFPITLSYYNGTTTLSKTILFTIN
jgi:hypothetical protein